MADTTISALPAATSAGRSDSIPGDQGGDTKRYTPAMLAAPSANFGQPPLAASLTWDNQGGVTAANAANGLTLTYTGGGTTQNTILYTATPAAPWSFTTLVAYITPKVSGGGNVVVGIAARQSSSGKYLSFGVINGDVLTSNYWNNTASFSAVISGLYQVLPPNPLWLRIADDGTTRTIAFSLDGENFINYTTMPRTDFATFDQVGVFLESDGGVAAQVNVQSWKLG